jgi:hypothetical protein
VWKSFAAGARLGALGRAVEQKGDAEVKLIASRSQYQSHTSVPASYPTGYLSKLLSKRYSAFLSITIFIRALSSLSPTLNYKQSAMSSGMSYTQLEGPLDSN